MKETNTQRVPATAKGEATRAHLLRTAAAIFAERGYAATTQNDLIAASGLTKGAFYFYFRSKADLALAVLREQKGRWLTEVGERVIAEPTASQQLRALVPTMLDLISREPAAWSVTRLTRELSADPALAAEVSKVPVDWLAFIADIVRRGQADGDLRAGLEPESVAAVLVGAFDGLKDLTDVLEPGDRGGVAFTERVRTFLAIVELALVPHPKKSKAPREDS
ncbi:TetR family transcriptional regulator [Actinoplanes sp. NPDC051346]|uniref:TetR family transcriptional regulator n=1 Tax=Actinoplanes sp. NPDC051346 TaxID=3155048 RepID=UPI00344A10EF